MLKDAVCKNWLPVELILKTNKPLLTVSSVHWGNVGVVYTPSTGALDSGGLSTKLLTYIHLFLYVALGKKSKLKFFIFKK